MYQSGFVARGPKKKNETHWKSIFSTSEDKCENTNGNEGESTSKHKETILHEKPSPELFKRLCQGGLPSKCFPYNTTSFALTNSHLYVLFSGYVKFVDKKREKRMNKIEEGEGICKD